MATTPRYQIWTTVFSSKDEEVQKKLNEMSAERFDLFKVVPLPQQHNVPLLVQYIFKNSWVDSGR